MISEHLDTLVTKAGINTQAMETITRLKTSKFSLQTTVLKVRFRDASCLISPLLISATATCTQVFQGEYTSFHQLRMRPLCLTEMQCGYRCPLGLEEMWSANLFTCVGVLAKGLSTGFKVNVYQKMRLG